MYIRSYPQFHVRIRSFFGLYSVRMRENADQKNSKNGHLSHSEKSKTNGCIQVELSAWTYCINKIFSMLYII